ncbi:hypothetical protein T4C_7611 [Trichinella pseudospiralis]|uniref:Uncharacterized protein n=1 Tax=Trichinella pseudospiralis TaxID=6337 RepID=A0A0V1JKI5_TRIPS|nr:hypothetical protein T4C_7611 [Trichinella pseudospiralis]
MTPSVQSFHNSMNRIPQLVITYARSKEELQRYAKSGDGSALGYVWLQNSPDLEKQVARCLETVAEFDFEVAVWPKKQYQNVGALS